MNFNSRPSARGDTLLVCNKITVEISIHAPPRGATHVRRVKPGGHPYFNSRPSARGDIIHNCTFETIKEFQFTPLREGRLQGWRILQRPRRISIHAPPRGATSFALCREATRRDISIHAPPRGATVRRRHARAQVLPISIHAPPRGATLHCQKGRTRRAISIHAPPRGATMLSSPRPSAP